MNQSKEVIYERQKKLLNYIKSNHSVRVSDASQYLGVSELTIRRDLIEMSNQHLVERFHGGARIKTPEPEYDIPMEEKENKHEMEKDAIAKKAASFVQEGDTVFLNSGSTTFMAMRYLDKKAIRIFTNNALAPSSISSERTELIMTGGECRHRSKALIGTFASNMLSKIFTNTCILGVNGIISTHGITSSNYQEAAINELMVKHCNGKVIIVADSSKIGKMYDFVSIGIEYVDVLITDSHADKEELERIRQAGVEIVMVTP